MTRRKARRLRVRRNTDRRVTFSLRKLLRDGWRLVGTVPHVKRYRMVENARPLRLPNSFWCSDGTQPEHIISPQNAEDMAHG